MLPKQRLYKHVNKLGICYHVNKAGNHMNRAGNHVNKAGNHTFAGNHVNKVGNQTEYMQS